MKKLLLGLVFILTGVGGWVALSNTAQYSIKRWDAKFNTTLQTGLASLGMKDSDLLSSFNEVIEDDHGEYVRRRISVRMMDRKKRTDLMKHITEQGADVVEREKNNLPILLVQRNGRTYQEIQFIPDAR